MIRDAPLTDRSYEYAVPIRAGNLSFPKPGPNALKKKGILGKAGNYFSKEAKLELCLLLKLSAERPGMRTNSRIFDEKKFIWTWDEDTEKDMLSFFRTEVEAMCRHTEAQSNKPIEKRPFANSHMGVCTRTECYDFLKAKDLLMKYLNASLSPFQRNQRYRTLLKKFPPSKEIVLFDTDLAEYCHGQVLAGGINKKTMRHVGHSNGKVLWVFDIAIQTSSKLEEIKNILRPITLHASRNSNERRFVLRYVASESKDSLRDWWKDVNTHVTGQSNICYEAEIRNKCDEEKLCQAYVEKDFSYIKTNDDFEAKMFIDKEGTLLGDSAPPRAVQFSTKSKLSVDQLKTYLLPSKNSKATQKFLDSYLIPSTEETMDTSNIGEMNVLVEPQNIKGDVQDKFGFNTQTMVLQAIMDSKVQGSTLGGLIPKSLKTIGLFKSVFESMGLTDETVLKRSFNIEKSYFFDSTGFTVTYSPSSSSNFADGIKLSGQSASFQQIILKVEDINNNRTVDVYGTHFEENFMENDIVTEEVRDCAKKHLQSNKVADFFSKFHVSGTPQGKTMELFAEAFFKNKNDSNSSRLAGIKLANFLINDKTLGKMDMPPTEKFYAEVIELVYDCCKQTSSPTIITLGLTVLYRLLRVNKKAKVNNLKKKIVNKANIMFAKIVAETVEANRTTLVPLRILEKAIVLLTKIVDFKRNAVFTSSLQNVEFVLKLAGEIVQEKERVNTGQTDVLINKIMALEQEVKFAVAKNLLEEQQKVIDAISALQEKYESETNRKSEENQIRSVHFTLLAVPYFSHLGTWEKTIYSVQNKEFVLEHPTKRVKTSLYGIRSYTLSELKKHGYNDDDVKLISSGTQIAELKVFVEALEVLTASNLTNSIEEELNKNYLVAKIRSPTLIQFMRQVRHALKEVPEVEKTKITLTAAANPEALYGKTTVQNQPDICKNWATSLYDGLNKGLNNYHSSITSDVNELSLVN